MEGETLNSFMQARSLPFEVRRRRTRASKVVGRVAEGDLLLHRSSGRLNIVDVSGERASPLGRRRDPRCSSVVLDVVFVGGGVLVADGGGGNGNSSIDNSYCGSSHGGDSSNEVVVMMQERREKRVVDSGSRRRPRRRSRRRRRRRLCRTVESQPQRGREGVPKEAQPAPPASADVVADVDVVPVETFIVVVATSSSPVVLAVALRSSVEATAPATTAMRNVVVKATSSLSSRSWASPPRRRACLRRLPGVPRSSRRLRDHRRRRRC